MLKSNFDLSEVKVWPPQSQCTPPLMLSIYVNFKSHETLDTYNPKYAKYSIWPLRGLNVTSEIWFWNSDYIFEFLGP